MAMNEAQAAATDEAEGALDAELERLALEARDREGLEDAYAPQVHLLYLPLVTIEGYVTIPQLKAILAAAEALTEKVNALR